MTVEQEQLNAALGAMLGTFAGDAAGGTLEFLGRKPREKEVNRAISMPGGGFWKLAPGQITDDGELTLSLTRGLLSSAQDTLCSIATQYAHWFRSKPFDLGNTIQGAWNFCAELDTGQMENGHFIVKTMQRQAKKKNLPSKANGSLMRCVPLGIWGHRLPEHQLVELAFADSRLSHPNPTVCACVACYVIAIASLVREPGNAYAAFERAKSWAKSHANGEVNLWLLHAENDMETAYHPDAGFIKIAFIHAFRHLQNKSPYMAALYETLQGGGDTDTNAAIVGGLVGAFQGVDGLPGEMVKKVLQCDTQEGCERPKEYQPHESQELVKELLHAAPSQLELQRRKSWLGTFTRLFR